MLTVRLTTGEEIEVPTDPVAEAVSLVSILGELRATEALDSMERQAYHSALGMLSRVFDGVDRLSGPDEEAVDQ